MEMHRKLNNNSFNSYHNQVDSMRHISPASPRPKDYDTNLFTQSKVLENTHELYKFDGDFKLTSTQVK